MTEHWSVERYHQEMGTVPPKTATQRKATPKNECEPIRKSEINPEGKQRPSKFGAKKTKVDGITFDSAREASYYSELKLLQQARVISGFARQCEFVLQDGTGTAIRYRADFVVWYPDGTAEVHEVKGHETDVWILKEKLFRARFPGVPLIVVK